MSSPRGLWRGRENASYFGFLILIAIFLFTASGARANSVSMEVVGVPSGATTLVVSDPTAAPGYTNATAVIDPYIAKIGGASTTTLVWCVDPDHEVNLNTPWTANVSYLGGDLSNTYLNNATTYGALGWLIEQLAATPKSNTIQRQEIQAAMWSLADPGGSNDFSYAKSSDTTFAGAVTALENSAMSNALPSGFEILTDVNGSTQEFMVITPTPEPATILLLGIGLVAVALGRRKFTRI